MLRRQAGMGAGVLHPAAYAGKFKVTRFVPPPPLAPYIEVLWTVSWDLSGHPPFEQYTLPNASVNVVLEDDEAEVVGVMSGRFLRVLDGRRRVFGAKFRPAMFRPWVRQPLHPLTDKRVPYEEVFQDSGRALAEHVLGAADESAMAERYAAHWRARLPSADARAEQLCALIEYVEREREITHVSQLCEQAGTSVRGLQRLFRDYVGVTPKWVIQRYRLIEAAEALAQNRETQSQLALRLGFSDQAHFVRAFRAIVGTTPAAYARANRPTAAAS